MSALVDMLSAAHRHAAEMKAFQEILNMMHDDSARKRAILDARVADKLDDVDTLLLIQAYGLEEA